MRRKHGAYLAAEYSLAVKRYIVVSSSFSFALGFSLSSFVRRPFPLISSFQRSLAGSHRGMRYPYTRQKVIGSKFPRFPDWILRLMLP